MERDEGLSSASIPQADDLDKVRAVVAAVSNGSRSSNDVVASTGFSLRHTEYRMRAAELLGLIQRGEQGLSLTADGKRLLAASAGSERERLTWLALFAAAPFAALVPDLFAAEPPDKLDLADRLVRATGMAASTAERRASTLLTWRRRLASRQLWLFDEAYL